MIIEANNDNNGWIMIDDIDWIQFDTAYNSLCGDVVVSDMEALDQIFDESDGEVLISRPEPPASGHFPFRVGRLFYRLRNSRGTPSPRIMYWRGSLCIMNDSGKTIESLYIPY